jgi:NAD+ synthase (glutamine-hydrolysing)
MCNYSLHFFTISRSFINIKPMKTLRVALAQINPTVGDLEGNAAKIIDYLDRARSAGAPIVAFPELAVTGYPPEDLLLKPRFIEDNLEALRTVARETTGIIAVAGFVDRKKDIFNAAAIMSGGEVLDVYHKTFLPNYGVFDEFRYFKPGTRCSLYDMGDISFGVTICEDIWYPGGPIRLQAISGADFIININASPYTMGKAGLRERMLSTRAADYGVIIAYLNTVGGQDELVFDGASLVVDEHGNPVARAGVFEEELLIVDLDLEAVFMRRLHDPRERQEALLPGEKVDRISLPLPESAKETHPIIRYKKAQRKLSEEEEVYSALVLGVKDYVRKNGFKQVVIGLSGGVDSALVASIASDALGRGNVHGLFMPSRFTSRESREDSYGLAENLGIEIKEVSIDGVFEKYLTELAPHFKGLLPNTTEENLQARIRGNLLMAFSNKFGWLVLTTGNKSEMSVGYATLYGDMAGGFAVIKDVPKTLVYRLARWRNEKAQTLEKREVIPARVLTKEPTAELRPNQKDTDSLPPYPVLDPVLKSYVEEDRSFEEILSMNGDPEEIKRVIRMVDLSEYKRRQAPPGIKITSRAFGRDRRFPITNRYRSF